MAGGTNAFNQLRERDVDARMLRTRGRPLPSGRVTPRAAGVFAAAISVAGVAYLAALVNLLTAGLAALTLVSYVGLYTPLKRRTSLNTLIGAVPGALPIVGGWTAAGGRLDAAALALFWIVFLWQLPHFLALAWIYREDYRRGGLAMLSVGDDDGSRTARMTLLYAAALLPVSLLPSLLGLTGALYFYGALALGVVYAAVGAPLLREARRAQPPAPTRRLPHGARLLLERHPHRSYAGLGVRRHRGVALPAMAAGAVKHLSAECGLRNAELQGEFVTSWCGSSSPSLFRIPNSAFRICH